MWLRLVHSAGNARQGLRRRREPRLLAQLVRVWTQGVLPSALSPCVLPSGRGAAGRGAHQRPATPPPSEPGASRGVCSVASKLGNPILDWGKGSAFGAGTHCGAAGRISALSPAERCARLSCLSGPAGGAGLEWVRGAYATASPTCARAALRPHRCLATAAAVNKGCLSQKGEGRRAAPRPVPIPLPPPPTAAMAPPGGGGAGKCWGAGVD